MKKKTMSDNKTYRRFRGLCRLSLAAVAALVVMPLAASDLNRKIDVAGNNITIRELFRQIEEKTGYTFAFNRSALDTSKRIELPDGKTETGEILNTVLRDLGFSYIVNDKHIIILPMREKQPAATGSTAVSPRAAVQPSYAAAQPARTVEPARAPEQSVRAAAQPARPATQPVRPAEQASQPAPQTVPAEKPAAKIDLPVVRADNAYTEIVDNSVYMVIPGRQVIQIPDIAPGLFSSHPMPATSLAGKLPYVPQSPRWAIKTNLLFDAVATMNLGVELRVSPKNTIELTGYYNPWSWGGNRKWKTIMVQPEFRYWICDPFAGHFLGAHVQWAHYNFSGVPVGGMKNYRYQGDLYGAGLSYGYSWYIGKRWALEATVGAGYNYLEYEKFDCEVCGTRFGWQNHHYIGITKLGLNLSFLIK